MSLPYWRLSGFYFFYFALLGATAPFYGLYFAQLGFSAERIGELIAIPMLMRCLAPNLWGWLADRSGQRLRIVRLGSLCALASFLLIFIDQSYAWLALVMALQAFFWHAVLPQFEVITLNFLGDEAHRYSQLRLWGSIGFVVAVILLGWVFDQVSLTFWPWSIALIFLCIVLSGCSLPQSRPPLAEASTGPAGPVPGFWHNLRRPAMLAFYAAVGLMQLSHGPYYSFISLYLETLGYSRTLIGLLWSLGVVAEILLFLFMGRLLQRFALRAILQVSFLLATLRWLLLAGWADAWPVLLLAQLLHAATFGSFHVAAIHFVQQHFPTRQQGQAQAMYATLSGIGGALGSVYAGHVWTALGPAWAFGIAALAAALAALIISHSSGKEQA